MVQPRRHGAHAGRLQRLGHLLRRARRCQIDIGDRAARERIAHRAADHARLGQRRHDRGQRRIRQEGRRIDPQRGRVAHRGAAWPDTILPSSSRAGS